MHSVFFFRDLVPGCEERVKGGHDLVTNNGVEVHPVLELTSADIRLNEADRKLKKSFFIHSVVSSWSLRGVMSGAGVDCHPRRHRNPNRISLPVSRFHTRRTGFASGVKTRVCQTSQAADARTFFGVAA